MKKIIIAGAGASGLTAAIAAARAGASVTVLEAEERPGRRAERTLSQPFFKRIAERTDRKYFPVF